ncbi:hypothetical protein LINGRAHAP2_LOCUS17461 [Linum grandiflorum]
MENTLKYWATTIRCRVQLFLAFFCNRFLSIDIGCQWVLKLQILYNGFCSEQGFSLHHQCWLWDARVDPAIPVLSIRLLDEY